MFKKKIKFLISLAFIVQSCSYASQNETLESKIFGKTYAQETNANTSRRSPEGNLDNSSGNTNNYNNASNVKLSDNKYDAYQHYQASTPPKKAKRRPILNLKELNELMDKEATISLTEKTQAAPEISAESNLNEVIKYNKNQKVKYKRPKKKVKVLVIKKDKQTTPVSPKQNTTPTPSMAKTTPKEVDNTTAVPTTKPASANSSIETTIAPQDKQKAKPEDSKASSLPPVSLPDMKKAEKVLINQNSQVAPKSSQALKAPDMPSTNNGMQSPVAPNMQGTNNGMQPPIAPNMPSTNNGMQPPVAPNMPSTNNGMQPPMAPNMQGTNDVMQPPVAPNIQGTNNGMQPPMAPNMQGTNDVMQPPVAPNMQGVNDSSEHRESIENKLNEESQQSTNSESNSSSIQTAPLSPVPGTDDSSMFTLDRINKFMLEVYYAIKFSILALLESWFRFD